MIRKIAAGLVVILSASSPGTQDLRPETSCKPEAPLSLSARLVGDPHAGAVCGLVVDLSPAVEGDVAVEVALPEGVTFVRGDRDFRGHLRTGQARQLTLDVAVSDTKRREILVSACVTCDGARLARVASVVLNEDGAPQGPQGVLKTNSRGEKILEFSQP